MTPSQLGYCLRVLGVDAKENAKFIGFGKERTTKHKYPLCFVDIESKEEYEGSPMRFRLEIPMEPHQL